MAFPATYDFNYYKGDTFEFRIYPKKNDGTVFDLSAFYVPTNYANDPDYVADYSAAYDSAQFTIAKVRGPITSTVLEDQPIRCFARVSDDNTYVLCAIRPSDADKLVSGIEYVYDVEVKKPSGLPGSGQYEIVNTLLTGTITVTDQVTGANTSTKGTLSDFTISGLTPPVACAIPDTSIIETSEYLGTVAWVGNPSVFDPDTVYTATITITPKSPYQIIGTPANKFTVDGATSSSNLVNSGVVTAVFPKTAKTISLSSINGITAPVNGATPNTSVAATSQYTAVLVWKEKSLEDPVTYSDFTGAFKPSRTYKAFITLTPKTGYTLCGVPADFFSVTGALSYANTGDSGIVTAEFPITGA